MKTKRVTKKAVLYWTVLNLGVLLLAAGVYFFKAPGHFATGGVSGIAIVLEYLTVDVLHWEWCDQTVLNAILNILLLIIGFIFLGRGCGFKTAYCVLVYTGEMYLFKLIPVNLPLTENVFLNFVYAMLITSAGSAIIFNCRASSGGTDIIALIIKKYTNVKNVGKALLLTDFIIALSSFITFGLEIGLYSMLGLFTKTFLVDGVIERIGKNKFVTIITAQPEMIAQFIIEGLHRGYTAYKAVGGYTGEEKTVMLTVCKRNEAYKLKTKIQKADPSAFVIITDSNETMGKGFDTL